MHTYVLWFPFKWVLWFSSKDKETEKGSDLLKIEQLVSKRSLHIFLSYISPLWLLGWPCHVEDQKLLCDPLKIHFLSSQLQPTLAVLSWQVKIDRVKTSKLDIP